ncbi:SPW repeat-containing protein [Amycolatopsis arida]|uniref:SPW repeat-containing protein n=1 Tax=Amycolatopsis arida TaxID=587909 RepID=A0A1I6AWG7_9PSEU|nr:SPW repeat protein [Amycolatopsis arida]TDX85383.1 SPW repeat-containing protein [Amycolatopsis arida]SFQ73055.1 SPW repeat-containing protein [Amycolatopsis arida]
MNQPRPDPRHPGLTGPADTDREPWPDERPGFAYDPASLTAPREDPAVASLPSALVFLAGVWLAASPFALDYVGTSDVSHWTDIVLGAAIAVTGLVRTTAPRALPWFSLVNVLLGAWLVVLPFVLGPPGLDTADTNRLAVGVVVALLAASSATLTFVHRRGSPDPYGALPGSAEERRS